MSVPAPPVDKRTWRERWANRAFLVLLAFLLIGVYFSARSSIAGERERAVRGECQAVNKAVVKIRQAVVNVAGYQAPIDPAADATLRRQIETSNVRRKAFAETQANAIPALRCPGTTAKIRDSTTTTVVVHGDP